MMNLVSVRLEAVLVSVQDRCMVCTKRTTALEIILDEANGNPRWNLIFVYSMMVLVSEQDRCTVCAKCTIGLEIVLDTPDGTPS
jgi:hypothetical protein